MAASAKRAAVGDVTSQPTPSSNLLPAWQPGQSGNPAGRPKGARSKLSEKVIAALLDSFERNGTETIEEVRKKSPSHYLAAIVSLLPKQQEKIESPFSDLSEKELQLLEDFLRSARAKPVIDVSSDSAEELPAAPARSTQQDQPKKEDGQKDAVSDQD